MTGTTGGHGPQLGAARALIGHDLRQTWPVPSGWRALCECGDTFHGIREQHALDRWHATGTKNEKTQSCHERPMQDV